MNMNAISKEYCIESLQAAYTYFEKGFSKNDYEAFNKLFPTYASVCTIISKFGSWNESKKEANVPISLKTRKAKSKEEKQKELLPLIHEATNILGNFFSIKDYNYLYQNDSRFPSHTTINKIFGSMQEARKVAGLPYIKPNKPKEIIEKKPRKVFTKEDCIASLVLCHEEIGCLSIHSYDDWRLTKEIKYPSSFTVRKLFSSWEYALSILPFEYIRPTKRESVVSHKEMAQKENCEIALLSFCNERERTSMESYEFWKTKYKNTPSVSTIIKTFGSWKEAISSIKCKK